MKLDIKFQANLVGLVAPIASRLRSSSSVRGVVTLTSGTIVAQALPILLAPVITRIYAPEEIGMLGLWTSFVLFMTHSMTLGYSQAIVTARSDAESTRLAVLCAGVAAPMSLLGATGFLLLVKSETLGYGVLPLWSALAMAISLGLTGTFSTLRYLLVRAGGYRSISNVTIAQSIGRMATQVGSGLIGLGWLGLILGELVSRASGLRRAWKEVHNSPAWILQSLSLSNLRDLAARYRDFALYAVPSNLVNNLALVLPVPLITTHYGAFAAGQYSIANNIMILPLMLVGKSIGDVFHSRVAEISRSRPERAVPLFVKLVAGLLVVGMVPAAMVLLFGAELFAIILGPNWRTSGEIATAIVPWVLLQFAARPVSRIVQVYRGQRIKLFYDVLVLSSVVGAITVGAYKGWSVVETCRLLGWTQASSYFIYILLLLLILRKNKTVNYVLPQS